MTETKLTELEIDIDELLVLALDNKEDRGQKSPFLNLDTGEIAFLNSTPAECSLAGIPRITGNLEKEIINEFICSVKDNGMSGELNATEGLRAFLETYENVGGRLLTFNIFKERYITTKTIEWLRDRGILPLHISLCDVCLRKLPLYWLVGYDSWLCYGCLSDRRKAEVKETVE